MSSCSYQPVSQLQGTCSKNNGNEIEEKAADRTRTTYVEIELCPAAAGLPTTNILTTLSNTHIKVINKLLTSDEI